MMPGFQKLMGCYRAVRQILADPRRKPIARMVREAASVALHTRDYPQKYFSAFAYRAGAGHHLDYLGRKENNVIQRWMLRRENAHVLDDKLLFHQHFSGASVALPRLLAHNEGKDFEVEGGQVRVEDGPAFARLVDRLRTRTRTGAVFAKPAAGNKGRGSARIDGSSDPAALYERVTSGRFLFEEAVAQHEAVGAIHPHSVNTVRVLTCVAADRRPVVLAALLRLGTGGRHVDNASAGGIYVGIDLATGRLLPEAKQHFRFGGQVHAAHPDTGFRFDGFELPHFRAVLAAAVAAADRLPHELVGWDFAVAQDGPVLIEGNAGAGLTILEIADNDGLLAHPVFRSLLGTLGLGPGRLRNGSFAGDPSVAWHGASEPNGRAGVDRAG
jgi:Sugar-transfer associated ATP-grasp